MTKTTDLMLENARLKAEREALLKTVDDLIGGLESLSKRVDSIVMSKPAAKVAKAATADEPLRKGGLSAEDLRKVLDAMAPEARTDFLTKCALRVPFPCDPGKTRQFF